MTQNLKPSIQEISRLYLLVANLEYTLEKHYHTPEECRYLLTEIDHNKRKLLESLSVNIK